MKTFCQLFHERVDSSPDAVAVHHRGEDHSYGQIAARADSFASWLCRQGVVRGDRIALLLENSADYVACYLGILRAGGVAVALNPDTTARELNSTLGDAAPVAAVVGSKAAGPLADALSQGEPQNGLNSLRFLIFEKPAHHSLFPQKYLVTELSDVFRTGTSPTLPEPGPDDLAQLIYTSGTTGRPKGIMLSHRNIAANCRSILEYLELTAADSVFVILPFFYSYGNSLLFTHLAAGGRLVLASNFVFWNQALDLMESQQASGFSGVPSSYAMLLHRSNFLKRKLLHLRYMTCAGGGLAPAVIQQLRQAVPHVRLFPMYGQTEATARLSTLLPEEVDSKVGAIGRGIPGVELKVLDAVGRPVSPDETGEIVARGENVMVGYWNDPEETARVLRPEGLWTGDLARIDDDGYLYIVGRKNDIIKSGAYRINPKEIEDVIQEVRGVADAAVVGLPDAIWGEVPVAFVVPSANGGAITEKDVVEHCRRQLPRYKAVHAVHFLPSLPKTSSGKTKRAELREAWQGASVGEKH